MTDETDVLCWGHARYAAALRRGQAPPPWIAAIQREYDHRRYLRRLLRASQAAFPARGGQYRPRHVSGRQGAAQ